MGVRAYDLLTDVARKFHKEEDDVVLIAVLEQHSDTMIPATNYAATIYDQYLNRGEIPDWMQAWLIDVMIGRFVLVPAKPNIISFSKKKGKN